MVGLLAVTVIAVSILSQIAIDHTTRYLESYEGIVKVEQFVEAERHAARLLDVTEDAINGREKVEKELEMARKAIQDLYARLNNKENVITEYCKSTQDLSRSNEILVRKLNHISFLVYTIIEKLPEEDREEIRKRFMEIMSKGGKTE